MLKVAFLHIVPAAFAYQWSLPPLGIGWIIAELRRTQSPIDIAFFRDAASVIEWGPDLVGVASDTGTITWSMEAARELRAATNAYLVLGGPHITALPHRLPAEFDLGIYGEGERTWSELVGLFRAIGSRRPTASELKKIPGLCWNENGVGVLSPARELIANLDDLPLPDRDILGDYAVPRWLRVHTIVSRGCPYHCAFCSSSALWPGLRQNSAAHVADEIEYLRNKYDPIEIYLFDDLLIANRNRFKDICRRLRERGLDKDIVFRGHARVNLLDSEYVDLLGEHNFRYLDFGIESNSAAVLAALNKTAVTPEINQRAMDLLKSSGLSAGASLIIGSPDETNDDIQQTWDFVVRNADVIKRVSCGMLVPLPGTKIWKDAEARGLVSETMDWSCLSNYATPEQYEEQYAKFPTPARKISREDLFDWFIKFKNYAESIAPASEAEYWEQSAYRLHGRCERAQVELKRLHGSRLMRLAMSLRDKLGKGH